METLLLHDVSLTFNKRQGRFLLSQEDKVVPQTVCEFLHTMSFLIGKDLEEHLLNPDREFDTIRVPLTSRGDTVTLDLHHFIRFRNAYSEQMFFLKLEDLLMRKGIKPASLF